MQVLLTQLRDRDIKLWLENNQLRYHSPKGALTEDLINSIRFHKENIIGFLIEAEKKSKVADCEIAIAPRDSKISASYAQQSMWFVHHFEQQSTTQKGPFSYDVESVSTAYNVQLIIKLKWSLNEDNLEEAINNILLRHEVLRTAFIVENNSIIQEVYKHEKINIEITPVALKEKDVYSALIESYAKTEIATQFDLSSGRLVRFKLLHFSDNHHVLLFTTHHIVFDGWSMGVFVKELSESYHALEKGELPKLSDLKIQYRDYAYWQQNKITDAYIDEFKSHWSDYMNGAPSQIELPFDRPRSRQQSYAGDVVMFSLPCDAVEKIKILASITGVTLYATCLSIFYLMLYRYTSSEDIVIGSPVASRSHIDLEPLIGDFVNLIVVRTKIDDDLTFRQLLKNINIDVRKAMEYQDLPFEKLVEIVQPDRISGISPIFQVMFSLQNTPISRLQLPGLEMNPVRVHTGTSMYDLSLSMQEYSNRLTGEFEFNVELFDKKTIENMMDNFTSLFVRVSKNHDIKLKNISILAEEQKNILLREYSGELVISGDENRKSLYINDLIDEQVTLRPDNIALVWGNQRIAYKELNQKVNNLALKLHKKGLCAGKLAAILLPRSHELIVAVLAVLKTGAGFLPLDSSLPVNRISYMLSDSLPDILLSESSLIDSYTQNNVIGEEGRSIEVVFDISELTILIMEELDLSGEMDEYYIPVISENRHMQSTAYIIYTSGTTGLPKAVQVSHQNLGDAYHSWYKDYHLDENCNHLQMANFTFDVFIGDLVRALTTGGKLVISPRDYLLEPDKLYELMVTEEINCAEFVPAVINLLRKYLVDTGNRLDFMRLLIVGSDIFLSEDYRQIQSLSGTKTRLINSYGVTEATIDTTFFEKKYFTEDKIGVMPIGRPMSNRCTYILDKYFDPVPVGVVGELFIGGRGIAMGYYNRPDLTADRFIPNPFIYDVGDSVSDNRLYKTGDKARYLHDGNIEFVNRNDHQVKIRGFRVELGEIESVINILPFVENSIVITNGEGINKQLVAFIQLVFKENTLDRKYISDQKIMEEINSDINLDITNYQDEIITIKEFIKNKLPDYMIPVNYIFLNSMPLTNNGKIDRRKLSLVRENYLYKETEEEYTYIPPQNYIEKILSKIWVDVLEVEIEKLSVEANFFDIGGHSLLGAQVITRIRENLAITVSIRCIFDHPTIRRMAEYINTLQDRKKLIINKSIEEDKVQELIL